MELGAIVCTSKSPRCGQCPIASSCAWLAAGSPENASGTKPKQKKYEGSDRQVRGAILDVLRSAAHSVTKDEVDLCWPNAATRDRALASLLADGLVIPIADDTFALPS
jgi:A/G-specific adenine glycosylase